MLDFLIITTPKKKENGLEVTIVEPDFDLLNREDIMTKGEDFYAIWDESKQLWSTNEQDAIRLIDKELDIYANEHKDEWQKYRVHRLRNASTKMIDKFHHFCKSQARDWFVNLDEKLIFSNDTVTKEDYASKILPYPLEACETPAWDELVGTLYSVEEREKIEWCIGSIVSGGSKQLQKFAVFYGAAGAGKSTVLNIIQKLFQGYWAPFDAKALGSQNESFALEAFRSNPLVAIQHDGDLSRIEDNTRLNSLVSHETMTINEKHKSLYSNSFKSFLFMATNKPVKITDAKSGLIRRLIDISPSGETVPTRRYNKLMKQIDFELGGIANKCKEVYLKNPNKYDTYIPIAMMSATNEFYNFIFEYYYDFRDAEYITLNESWAKYKVYCEESNNQYPLKKMIFQEELKNYFYDFKERYRTEDGAQKRSVYLGFRTDKFKSNKEPRAEIPIEEPNWLEFKEQESIFDKEFAECIAQYAKKKDETPRKAWESVTSTLKDLDTSLLHYVLGLPINHIVVDFDIPDDEGNKCLERNLEAANKFPPTYAELSKSGQGIHLHYIYVGDVEKLKRVYADHIEVKVFTGKASLRRRLTKCNDISIATISSGLPLKGEKKMIDFEGFKNEEHLRKAIEKNLRKEVHSATKPSMDLIFEELKSSYESEQFSYDVTNMRKAIWEFAKGSTNQQEKCMKIYKECIPYMVSKDILEDREAQKRKVAVGPVVFYDCEVFENLFVVVWKVLGSDRCVRMINPDSHAIEELKDMKLVGHNCRKYDNHILYARMLGYNNKQLYTLSQRIIYGDQDAFFRDAYNWSYADTLDYPTKKQSLKKWEIELDIHHKELGLAWDKPVPEELWETVADYCENDVRATEAVFLATQADFKTREGLARLTGLTVNDTTNTHSTKFIFQGNRNPQNQFNYRDLGVKCDDKPYFEGYTFDKEKKQSIYRGEIVGEGGYVYSEPGVYENVALLDIASMHPTSIIQEELFGREYTKRFREIVEARLAIKHKDFESARKMLNGALAPYLDDEADAKNISQALKIVINSVYGLTSAKFTNPFRDPRNDDNIVAKRGALFMIDLKHAVQERGYTVAHIKTDSIKIPNADNDIIQFVMDFGHKYGYNFEHEDTYQKMCLVNKSTYIAKDQNGEWTATGTQFQIPYVFKTLFSHEPIIFKDKCEAKQVKSAMYLDMNESLPDGEHNYIFIGKVGSFCPIKPGCGGGKLLREAYNKMDSVVGTKDYRWLEAETVQSLEMFDDIDISYYDRLVDEAVDDINKFCMADNNVTTMSDFEAFVS